MDILKRNMQSKIFIILVIALFGLTAFAPYAFAGNAMWYFDFQKGEKSICGSAHKDYVQDAYFSLKQGNNYFVEGQSVLGARIRTLSGNAATNYHTYSYYTGNPDRWGYFYGYNNAGWDYNLHGQVDDASGTQWIRAWGYYCP